MAAEPGPSIPLQLWETIKALPQEGLQALVNEVKQILLSPESGTC